jgi:hypothetical protein
LESTSLGLHSRESSTRSESWSKALLAGDWRALTGGFDAGAADGRVNELAGAAAAASGETRTLTIPATAKYIAM